MLVATDFGYDWLAAKPIFQLQGHKRSVLKLSLTDDPWKLISLSSDKILKVWDLRVNKCVQVKPRVSLPIRSHCSTACALVIDGTTSVRCRIRSDPIGAAQSANPAGSLRSSRAFCAVGPILRGRTHSVRSLCALV